MPINRKTLSIAVGAALLLALPSIAGITDEPYLITLFSRILIYAIAAVSLDLMLGFGGMVSLGHAAFFGIGAYVVSVLSFHAFEGTALLGWPFQIEGTQAAMLVWPAAVLLSAAVPARAPARAVAKPRSQPKIRAAVTIITVTGTIRQLPIAIAPVAAPMAAAAVRARISSLCIDGTS